MAQMLSKDAVEKGWTYVKGSGMVPAVYVNTKTGQRSVNAPLPSGWRTVQTPAGDRYVSQTGSVSAAVPTTPSVKPAPAAAAPAEVKKTPGNIKPRPVVSAKGIMSGDKDKTVLKTGGQPILTTPFGIIGGGSVAKKKLLGA